MVNGGSKTPQPHSVTRGLGGVISISNTRRLSVFVPVVHILA